MSHVISCAENAMSTSHGLHHVTALAGDPARNVAFYRDVLGLRMVKRTVNFDDPGTYHLYYGDEVGSPGTIMTFFPWPGAPRGRIGTGQAAATAFAVPEASLGYWLERLVARGIAHEAPRERFGRKVVALSDPDGLRLELVSRPDVAARPGWAGSEVPAEHAIRGFHGVTLWSATPGATGETLKTLGLVEAGREGASLLYAAAGEGLGTCVEVRDTSGFPRGEMGAGTVHHVAFRAAGDADQAALVAALSAHNRIAATEQVDRNYFRSVYFREPGGTLFEIATDDPGFAIDEPREALGASLMLPPWYEPNRARIEAALPRLG